jgi:hypothetical protein
MPPFIFRRAKTGLHAQGPAPDDDSEEADDIFCRRYLPAHGSVHLVNPTTCKRVGESSE